MNDLVELFCSIDDFWKTFKSEWDTHLIINSRGRRGPEPELSNPEMMTIVVLFHQSNYRTFKTSVLGFKAKFNLRGYLEILDLF